MYCNGCISCHPFLGDKMCRHCHLLQHILLPQPFCHQWWVEKSVQPLYNWCDQCCAICQCVTISFVFITCNGRSLIKKYWNSTYLTPSCTNKTMYKGHMHTHRHNITTQQQMWVCLLERNGVWRQLKINSSDEHHSWTQSKIGGGGGILVT